MQENDNDPIDSILRQFLDLGLTGDQFEYWLQRAITRGKQRIDETQWLRDKHPVFYFGMMAVAMMYRDIHRAKGIILTLEEDGRLFDDKLLEDLTLVIKSVTQ